MRTVVIRELTECAHCGAGFRKVAPHQTYCTRTCQLRAYNVRRALAGEPKVQRGSGGRPLRPQQRDDIECAHCGRWFTRVTRGARTPAKYCSRRCKENAARRRVEQRKRAERPPVPSGPRLAPIVCAWCGEQFQPKASTRRYCSLSCAAASRHGRDAGRVAADGPRLCEVVGCDRVHAAKGLCINHYNRWRRQSGIEVAPGSAWPSKRAEYWGVAYEPINPAKIYERDGYVCQLCREPVDVEKFHPHPSSPSLDHIVPMSKGGPHLRDNVQTAHLGCNVKKGNRT